MTGLTEAEGFYAYAGNRAFFACIAYKYEADRTPGEDYFLTFHERIGPAVRGVVHNAEFGTDKITFVGDGLCGGREAEIDGEIVPRKDAAGRTTWYLSLRCVDPKTANVLYAVQDKRLYYVGLR